MAEETEISKAEETLKCFGYMLHEECKAYALNQMLDSDFILLSDANFKDTADVRVTRGDEKMLQTVKRSSEEKYDEFYDKKLENIIEKFLKSNA